jgi:hypothetical protein
MHLANSWLGWIREGKDSFMGALEMPADLRKSMEDMLCRVIRFETAAQMSSSEPLDAFGHDDEYDLP